ncbi:HNH endonuclease family protein [Streptomyces sp. SID5785]|uniref:HNH endonuclease family protein n=1 Tax=Streptomyces sp. SID5785 TaxID=2690309 RepID=UPI001F3CC87E|nr:HNH endonuclease family protein [Streptomyces sp. SID5785]
MSLLVVLGAGGCGTQTDGTGPSGTPAADGPSGSAASGAPGAPEATGTLPGMPTAQQARQQLTTLKVAAHGSMSGYSRDRFPHWAEQGDDCNTRETVLARDGKDVERDGECRAVSGTWVSVYDDKKFTSASGLDIDHTVPLANAWRSGASKWTQEQRKAFANDLTHPQLLSVSAGSNRSKGDQGPDEWQPPAKAYWCSYARSWVSVKATYALTVTEAEKTTLTEMLDTCS